MLLLADRNTKLAKSKINENAVFKLFSLGVITNRDEWVYDFSQPRLVRKISFFTNLYNLCIENEKLDFSIKWSSSLECYFKNKTKASYNENLIQRSLYRPYIKYYHYTDKLFNHRLTENHYETFSYTLKSVNKVIIFSSNISSKPFHCLASDSLVDLHLTGDSQYLPLYRYDKKGNRTDNITDWGLEQFQTHYQDPAIIKLDIFHYTYAVLHNPEYRKKYELNLKREFPRLPFYEDFQKWVNWGN